MSTDRPRDRSRPLAHRQAVVRERERPSVPAPAPGLDAGAQVDSRPGTDGYEVGYGRPPKHTQFRKGRSGNPKGRPKRSKSLGQELLDELNRKITITENGEARRVTKLQALVKSLIANAIKNDGRSIKVLMEALSLLEPRSGEDENALSETETELLDRFVREANRAKTSTRDEADD